MEERENPMVFVCYKGGWSDLLRIVMGGLLANKRGPLESLESDRPIPRTRSTGQAQIELLFPFSFGFCLSY